MPKGLLVLVGSGEFTDAMLEVDQYLLKQIKNPKVAILPTAAGQEKAFPKWILDGVKHFKNLKAEVSGMNLKTRQDAQNGEVLNQLNECNFYYFSGGDPNHLLQVLKGSKAWDLIYKRYQNGAILVGSSAGAMVFGKKVWAKVYQFSQKGKIIPWEKGLEVVDFGIMPHFNMMKTYFNDEQMIDVESNYPKDISIIGIDEDTAYIKMAGKWQILGKGKIHESIHGLF